jgi:hypothetical protein
MLGCCIDRLRAPAFEMPIPDAAAGAENGPASAAPADPDAEQAWLKESERRLSQIEAGTATTIPGIAVLREARARLKHQDWVVDSSPSSTAA